MSAESTGEYRPREWQIVEEELGYETIYETIYETNEDGAPGDLVASVYGDNAHLIAASPALYDALEAICSMQAEHYSDGMATHMALISLCKTAHAALALARGEAA